MKHFWMPSTSAVSKMGPVCLVLGLLLSVAIDVEAKKPDKEKPPRAIEVPAQVTFLALPSGHVDPDPLGPYEGVLGSTFRCCEDLPSGNKPAGRILWINAPLASCTDEPCPPDNVFGFEDVRFNVHDIRDIGNVTQGNVTQERFGSFRVINTLDLDAPPNHTYLRFDGAPDDRYAANTPLSVTGGCWWDGGFPVVFPVLPAVSNEDWEYCTGGEQPSFWHVTSLRPDDPPGAKIKSLAGIYRWSTKYKSLEGKGLYELEFEAVIELK